MALQAGVRGWLARCQVAAVRTAKAKAAAEAMAAAAAEKAAIVAKHQPRPAQDSAGRAKGRTRKGKRGRGKKEAHRTCRPAVSQLPSEHQQKGLARSHLPSEHHQRALAGSWVPVGGPTSFCRWADLADGEDSPIRVSAEGRLLEYVEYDPQVTARPTRLDGSLRLRRTAKGWFLPAAQEQPPEPQQQKVLAGSWVPVGGRTCFFRWADLADGEESPIRVNAEGRLLEYVEYDPRVTARPARLDGSLRLRPTARGWFLPA